MPDIEFVDQVTGIRTVAQAKSGEALMDVSDTVDAPIPFSCRITSCGTCCVKVLEGLELLEPAEGDEADLIEAFGLGKDRRFACAARLRKGAEGKLVVQAKDAETG